MRFIAIRYTSFCKFFLITISYELFRITTLLENVPHFDKDGLMYLISVNKQVYMFREMNLSLCKYAFMYKRFLNYIV